MVSNEVVLEFLVQKYLLTSIQGSNTAEIPLRKIVLSSYAIAALLVAAYWSSYSYSFTFSPFQAFFGTLRAPPPFVCEPHQYTTEIVSIDPLLIYINNFVSAEEADLLIAEGYLFLPFSLIISCFFIDIS